MSNIPNSSKRTITEVKRFKERHPLSYLLKLPECDCTDDPNENQESQTECQCCILLKLLVRGLNLAHCREAILFLTKNHQSGAHRQSLSQMARTRFGLLEFDSVASLSSCTFYRLCSCHRWCKARDWFAI